MAALHTSSSRRLGSGGQRQNSSPNLVESETDNQKKTGWELNEEYGEISDESEVDEDDSDWSPSRRLLHRILRHTAADVVLGAVIAVSLIIVIIETDATAEEGGKAPDYIHFMNIGFTVLYSVELVLRLYVYRLRFFCHWFNNMDFVIVVFDIGLKILQGGSIVSTLRIFRLAKLGRVLVLLEKFPELHMILRGIYCTIKSIFWGMCLLGTIILIWSVLGTQLIHPINRKIDYGDCERCERAFGSVASTFLTIFQTVVAGDSWGTVAVPIIEKNPLTMAYFVTVFVSISLLVLNLILATTVERASAAKDEDQAQLRQQVYEEKRKAYAMAAKKLKAVCKQMDINNNGALTVEELEEGFHANPDFHSEMKAMDIKKDDMQVVFKLLDADKSGDVDYEEFVESLHMMKTRDSHTLLMFTHQLVEDILQKSSAEMRLLTSKSLVNRISDEVTKKTLTALAPLLERSTKPSQERRGFVEAELQDNEAPIASLCGYPKGGAAPPRKEEDLQVSISSDGLKPLLKEEVQPGSRRGSSERQEAKRGQPRVLAPSSDAAPSAVVVDAPLRSEAEGGPLSNQEKSHDQQHMGNHGEGESVMPADQDLERKLGAPNQQVTPQANRYREVRIEESANHTQHQEGTVTASSAPTGESGDFYGRNRIPHRWKMLHSHRRPSDTDEALARIAATLQHMEQQISSIGGAGRHSQWCPACTGGEGAGPRAAAASAAGGGPGQYHSVTSI